MFSNFRLTLLCFQTQSTLVPFLGIFLVVLPFPVSVNFIVHRFISLVMFRAKMLNIVPTTLLMFSLNSWPWLHFARRIGSVNSFCFTLHWNASMKTERESGHAYNWESNYSLLRMYRIRLQAWIHVTNMASDGFTSPPRLIESMNILPSVRSSAVARASSTFTERFSCLSEREQLDFSLCICQGS